VYASLGPLGTSCCCNCRCGECYSNAYAAVAFAVAPAAVIVVVTVIAPACGAAGPWACKVLRPIQNVLGPIFNKTNGALQKQIDNLPPSVSAFLDLKTSTSQAGSFSKRSHFVSCAVPCFSGLPVSANIAYWE